MQSSLFLRETGRRLRSACGAMEAEYLHRRYRWMSAFHDPDEGAFEGLTNGLADAVERNDPEGYAGYAAEQVETMLDSGMAPIVLLAASELFEQAVLSCLTPDQQDVVFRFFAAARDRRQLVMSNWFNRIEAAGA
jgi:hypothetical protein